MGQGERAMWLGDRFVRTMGPTFAPAPGPARWGHRKSGAWWTVEDRARIGRGSARLLSDPHARPRLNATPRTPTSPRKRPEPDTMPSNQTTHQRPSLSRLGGLSPCQRTPRYSPTRLAASRCGKLPFHIASPNATNQGANAHRTLPVAGADLDTRASGMLPVKKNGLAMIH